MKWEFLGRQKMQEVAGRGHLYLVLMWRASVPGGWLVMSINRKSEDPQPIVTFYPDPAHSWQLFESGEANYLLRPVGPDTPSIAPPAIGEDEEDEE